MKTFTTKPTEVRKDIDFALGPEGEEKHFTFKAPKASSQIIGFMSVRGKGMEADLQRAGEMLKWFSHGLNQEHDTNPAKKIEGHEEFVEDCQACQIQAMLDDPTPGSLELETVMEVIAWLMEELSGRPTT